MKIVNIEEAVELATSKIGLVFSESVPEWKSFVDKSSVSFHWTSYLARKFNISVVGVGFFRFKISNYSMKSAITLIEAEIKEFHYRQNIIDTILTRMQSR